MPAYHYPNIKVLGVGDAGSNVVDLIINQGGIRDIGLAICNTDRQALDKSSVPKKLEMGGTITNGLGAGTNIQKGFDAAHHSELELKELILEGDTKMLVIVAGLGGGTGGGASPLIAEIAKASGIFTVAVVTIPFHFEGKIKMTRAIESMAQLRDVCDSVIVTPAQSIIESMDKLSIGETFVELNKRVSNTIRSFTEIITIPGYVNVDFEDIKTILSWSKYAISSSAMTSGPGRARKAAIAVSHSLKFQSYNLKESKQIILSIISGEEAELQMDELAEITDFFQEFCGDDAEVIFGHGIDPGMGSNIKLSVIWGGLDTIHLDEEDSTTELMDEVRITIDHGNAPPEIVAELMANLSFRYKLMNGGSGLNFEFLDVSQNQSVEEV